MVPGDLASWPPSFGWSWSAPPSRLQVSSGQVHVWRVRLDGDDGGGSRLEATLSPEERERADRFHLDAHRRSFVVARGALRVVLGRYLHEDPARLVLVTGDHGKPFLPGRDLRFNVSHSAGLALYAVTAGVEVGVDVERISDGVDHEAVAARFFSRRERDELLAVAPGARRAAFFACWARKEAIVKAVGKGLSIALSEFDVPVRPDTTAAAVLLPKAVAGAQRWTLLAVDVEGPYSAAVAVEGSVSAVRGWDWTLP